MNDHSFGFIIYYSGSQGLEFLLIRQVAGHWGFPKGHPEEDEDAEATAKRELLEETGISEVSYNPQIHLDEAYDYPEADMVLHKTVTYFLGKVAEKTVKMQAEEITEYCWVSFEKALETFGFESSRSVLRKAYPLIKQQHGESSPLN
jgi:bis(5'-nucleosidyl)-tetraphosphatase